MGAFHWALDLPKAGSAVGRLGGGTPSIGLGVPLLALVHSLQLGYGLLGLLPLALFASLVFGSWVSLKEGGRKWLPYHLIFAAVTLAGSLMHLWRVVYFR